MDINYDKTIREILSDLPSRKREVVEHRYGIATENPLTLQAIGDQFNITRERVRQIENDALGWIKEKRGTELEASFKYFLDYFEEYGGLRGETALLNELGREKFRNHVYLLLVLGDDFKRFKETKEFFPFWATQEDSPQRAKSVLEQLISEFKRAHSPLPLEELGKKVTVNVNTTVLVSYIDVSKFIFQSPFGMYGLLDWPEVNPRGLKDKAYLVLKREQEPLHFLEIAKLIERLPGVSRKILPESVHNELIRNENFVLVGRGIYALKEWGYAPGTVKDIIIEILQKAGRALSKEEILEKALKQRTVKESTVLLNLQDKTFFCKNGQGKYELR